MGWDTLKDFNGILICCTHRTCQTLVKRHKEKKEGINNREIGIITLAFGLANIFGIAILIAIGVKTKQSKKE